MAVEVFGIYLVSEVKVCPVFSVTGSGLLSPSVSSRTSLSTPPVRWSCANCVPAHRRQRRTGRVATALLLLAAIAIAGYLMLDHTFRNQLTGQIQSRVDQTLAGTGVASRIGSAEFIDEQGLKLRNVHLKMPGVELLAYETMVAMPVRKVDLLVGQPVPRGVIMRRLKLKIDIDEVQQVDWSALIQRLSPSGSSTNPIPISIRDSEVQFIGRSSPNGRMLSDVNVDLVPQNHQGRAIWELKLVGGEGETGGQLSASAWFDPLGRSFTSSFAVQRSRIERSMLNLLPPTIVEKLTPVSTLTARTDVRGTASGNMNAIADVDFAIDGSVYDLVAAINGSPEPLIGERLDFDFDRHGLRVDSVTGSLGPTRFKLSGQKTGWASNAPATLRGQVADFDFDLVDRFRSLFPQHCQKFCNEFSPGGRCDINLNLEFDGRKLNKDMHASVTDMSFLYRRFPYPVEHCTGEIHWVDNEISYRMRRDKNDYALLMDGRVHEPGPAATWEVNLGTEGSLPIDDPLRRAMESLPELHQVVAAFNPEGRIAGTGVLTKLQPGGLVDKKFNLSMAGVTVSHNSFPYRIENIRGTIVTHNDAFWFENLTGSNAQAAIQCDGTWKPVEGLAARFICNQVPLDRRLRRAMRPELQGVWDGFRPQGIVDLMKVDLTLPPGAAECDIVLDADLAASSEGVRQSDISIFPGWFPYRIDDLVGNVHIGEGKVELTGFKGRHGRTWLVSNGTGKYSADAWSVTLTRMLVGSLRVTEDLLVALPTELSPSVRKMDLNGLLNVEGELTLAGSYDQPNLIAALDPDDLTPLPEQKTQVELPATTMAWDVRFNTSQATMFVGLPLENVFGSVRLQGTYDGDAVRCRGDLDIDSLTIYDAQISNIRGPIWLDNERSSGGDFAVREINRDAYGNVAPSGSSEEPATAITGQVYGGVVRFDGTIDNTSEGEFYLHTSLADADLKHACRELAPTLTHVQGHVFAGLRLAGKSVTTDSWRGDGMLQVRNAQIYELPPMVSLLKLLQIKQVDRTAFDSGHANFRIEGETVSMDRIEFNGDAISMIGEGTVTRDQELDLDFYTVVGRNRYNIPIISDLYRASSQSMLWIKIDGPSHNPRMNQYVMPQLNDSLRQLFQQPTVADRPSWESSGFGWR